MKSGKQRKQEIMDKRRGRLSRAAKTGINATPYLLPRGAIFSNTTLLSETYPYSCLPLFYEDRAFNCRDCGIAQIWSAKQQRWWYEQARGHIDSVAVRCRHCRQVEGQRKTEARRIHLAGLKAKQGLTAQTNNNKGTQQ
ncbi:MAG: zinc-ribbon domain containing protein [Pseudomonadota bacterium]